MGKRPLILGINGSPHRAGITSKLLGLLLRAAREEGAETKKVFLYDLKIAPDSGSYSISPKHTVRHEAPRDDMTALYPTIVKAGGLVFASPCYWANMSGPMKTFIDRLTPLENDGFKLQGKVAAFIAASKENEGGVEMAAMSMVAALGQMGVLIPPNGIMWYPSVWHTAKGSVRSWALEDAPRVGRNMVRLIRLLGRNRIVW